MNNENGIEVGDIIRVDFNGSQYTLTSKAEVIYCPGYQGDSWILKDLNDNNRIIYLSEPCTISKLVKE